MKTHGKWANCIGFDKSNKVATAAAEEQQLVGPFVCTCDAPKKKRTHQEERNNRTRRQVFFCFCFSVDINKLEKKKNLNVLIVKS